MTRASNHECKHFCKWCLHSYSREDLLEAHKPECKGIGQTAARVEMPEEGKHKLAFQNHHKQVPVPYIIYSEIEALTTKIEETQLDFTKNNTQNIQHHEACSYCYIMVRCDGQTEPPVEYRGPSAAEHFLLALQEEEHKIKMVLANPKAMRMTREDWKAHRHATTCHVCEESLEGDSVCDHCRITGKYRGAAHSACNLKLQLSPKTTTIPVVFHLYPSLSDSFDSSTPRSFCLPASAKLVAANQPEAFRVTARYEPDQHKHDLLMRKGVYPYEYMDSWACFNEPSLLPKEAFYSKFSGSGICDEDCTYAQKVWKVFGCKNLGEYSDLYCHTDVLLLADVFETF